MGVELNFKVGETASPKTIKDYLRRECSVSAGLLTALKKEPRGILKNGDHARSIDKVYPGDVLTLTLPDDKNEIPPVDLPITVLYEDEHVIVYDKPPFMAVHPVRGHQGDTLANAAAFYAMQKGEHYCFRAINRLDRDTSGTLLAAKNAYAAPILSETAQKVYIGVCEGELNGSFTINKPIRLKPGHTIERETGEGGQPAVTHCETLYSGNGHTLIRFILETGRTHQIRVHMASIGHPLAGDDMYGGSRELIARQALHCSQISFLHPITHERMTVCANLSPGSPGGQYAHRLLFGELL